jgi:hypothetical protein
LSSLISTGTQKPSALIEPRHFIDMSRVESAYRARRHAEIVDRPVNGMKRRQGIVSHSTSLEACLPEPVHLLAAAATLDFR